MGADVIWRAAGVRRPTQPPATGVCLPMAGPADAHRPLTRSSRARRAVLWGGGLFVVANLATGVVAERYIRLRDPLFGDKRVKLTPKLHTGKPLVVMLGSSRTGLAFHGQHLEATRPVSAFNYGIPASGPVTELVTLHRLLTDGVKPALVLVEVLPAMLQDQGGPPRESAWLYADRLTGPELATVVRHGFPAQAVDKRWRESVLVPAYALRFQIMCRLAPSALPWPLRFDWSRGADECGYGSLVDQNPDQADRDRRFALTRAEYAGILANYHPGGPAVGALREMIDQCREVGVPVRLVLMPESSQFRALYGPGANDRLLATLGTLPASLIDARDWLADDEFNDGHHMLTQGARRFTDRLAREVVDPMLAP